MTFPLVVRSRRAFAALLGITSLVFIVMSVTNQPLQTPAAPQGIVSFQLVHTPAAAAAILASWDARAKMYAGFNLGFDYLFMPLYMITLASACEWLARKRSRFGHWPAWGVGAAALLDALENIGQWHMLTNAPLTPWPQLTALAAVTKFGLLGVSLSALLIGGAYAAWRKNR